MDVAWVRRKVEAYERMDRVGMVLQTVEVRGMIDLVDELTARVGTLERMLKNGAHRGAFESYCVGDVDSRGCGATSGAGVWPGVGSAVDGDPPADRLERRGAGVV